MNAHQPITDTLRRHSGSSFIGTRCDNVGAVGGVGMETNMV